MRSSLESPRRFSARLRGALGTRREQREKRAYDSQGLDKKRRMDVPLWR